MRHATEAARHDVPAARRRAGDEDAQDERARLQLPFDPDRHGGEFHDLLPDIIDAAPADRGAQLGLFLARQVGANERLVAEAARNRIAVGPGHGQLVELGEHQLALAGAAAPPGGDVGQLQLLAENAPAEFWHEAHHHRRFHHAGAECVG